MFKINRKWMSLLLVILCAYAIHLSQNDVVAKSVPEFYEVQMQDLPNEQINFEGVDATQYTFPEGSQTILVNETQYQNWLHIQQQNQIVESVGDNQVYLPLIQADTVQDPNALDLNFKVLSTSSSDSGIMWVYRLVGIHLDDQYMMSGISQVSVDCENGEQFTFNLFLEYGSQVIWPADNSGNCDFSFELPNGVDFSISKVVEKRFTEWFAGPDSFDITTASSMNIQMYGDGVFINHDENDIPISRYECLNAGQNCSYVYKESVNVVNGNFSHMVSANGVSTTYAGVINGDGQWSEMTFAVSYHSSAFPTATLPFIPSPTPTSTPEIPATPTPFLTAPPPAPNQ